MKWIYLQRKKPMYLSPYASVIAKSIGFSAEKVYVNKADYPLTVIFRKGEMWWYSTEKRHNELLKENTDYVIKNPKYITKVKKRFIKEAKKFEKYFTALAKKDFKRLINTELTKDYLAYCKNYENCYIWSEPLPWLIKDSVADYLRDYLTKKGINDVDNVLNTLIHPNDLSFIKREERDLFLLAKKIQKKRGNLDKKDIDRMLSKHAKKYLWIPYDYGVTIWTEKHFRAELNKISKKDAEAEIKKIDLFYASLKGKQKSLMKNLELKIIDIIESVKLCSMIMDYKKEIFTRSHVSILPMLKEICSRLDLNLEQLCFMTTDEIKKSLYAGKLAVDKQKLNSRYDFCVMQLQKKDALRIFTEKNATRLAEKVENKEFITKISGVIACVGKSKGKVRVILDAKYIRDLKKGEVLVTTMTSPDYILGMRKAAGIITDEGGLTSHAAIISRELGIPCIVGTKHATKVLKTGNLVLIDATIGKVSVLEK